ncbi:MAG: hypothetical protein LBB89_06930 [Treponema sp.]|nr:hypothetical protein [Treponema sp.]
MIRSHLLAGLFFCLIGVFPLNAVSVSFLVMETGQSREDPAGQYPILWENGLLEIFFESGHIVTNSPIIKVAERPADNFPREAEDDFEEARRGGMDFFLVGIVDYTRSDVSLRLFNTKSPVIIIQEQKYTVTTFRNTREEYENIKKAVRLMAAHLNQEGKR